MFDQHQETALSGTAGAKTSEMGVAAPSGTRLRALSFSNISAIYIFAVMFVVFSLWVPDTFLQWSTWKSLLDTEALTAIAAIGLTLALSAGLFNLAIGAEVGFAAILVAWLLGPGGVAVAPAIAITVLAGALIGLTSAGMIVRARIDSFIATLGISSILLAMIAWISHSEQILDLPQSFAQVATGQFLGLTYATYAMIAIALLAWYALEFTPVGRRVYATGGNLEAARLAGVRTSLTICLALVVSGIFAAIAGILATSRIGIGDPTVGPSYLLPAFAASFLGSTQFRNGRFNIAGTVVAVYVLATGVKGLQLAGGPVWVPDLFNGVALLVAVGLARYERTAARSTAIRRVLRRGTESAPAR